MRSQNQPEKRDLGGLGSLNTSRLMSHASEIEVGTFISNKYLYCQCNVYCALLPLDLTIR